MTKIFSVEEGLELVHRLDKNFESLKDQADSDLWEDLCGSLEHIRDELLRVISLANEREVAQIAQPTGPQVSLLLAGCVGDLTAALARSRELRRREESCNADTAFNNL